MSTLIEAPLPLNANIERSFVSLAKAYGQISTIHHSTPYVRTVHFHYLPKENLFFLNANAKSRKHQAAQKNAVMAGCYWDTKHHTQFSWQAPLFHANNLKHDLNHTQKEVWLLMREEVRLAYYMEHDGLDLHQKNHPTYDLDTPAPNHAVLYFRPHYWDIFSVSLEEHRLSTRKIYRWQENAWKQENVSILHTP